jgi:preprotein translocase subunit SecG
MAWWAVTLFVIYVLTCVVLVIAVLLQPGKAGAAALFGGGASQTAFGPRGATNFLGWVTIVSAAIFIFLSLIFALPNVLGPKSVVEGGAAPLPVEQPAAAPAQPPATPPANQPAAAPSGSPTGATPSATEKTTQPKSGAASSNASGGASKATEKPAQPK